MYSALHSAPPPRRRVAPATGVRCVNAVLWWWCWESHSNERVINKRDGRGEARMLRGREVVKALCSAWEWEGCLSNWRAIARASERWFEDKQAKKASLGWGTRDGGPAAVRARRKGGSRGRLGACACLWRGARSNKQGPGKGKGVGGGGGARRRANARTHTDQKTTGGGSRPR